MESFRQRLGNSARAFAAVARNRNLRRLSAAFAGSELGAWGYSIALSVLAFRDGGAARLGLLTLVLMATPAVAAPFTALLGDRFDRVRVLVAADLVRVALMAAAATLVFTGAPLGFVYALAGLSAVASTAFRPAQAAIVPSLANTPAELTAANVVASTVESVSSFGGPALGGAILAATEPGVAFAVAAGTFLWSALLVGSIRPGESPAEDSEPADTPREGVAEALRAGARAVFEPRVRLLVGTIGAQTLVAGALIVFVPVVALGYLDVGEQGLGTIYSALGVGGVAGAVGAAALVGRRRLTPSFLVGTVLWGAPLALLAAGESFAVALVLFGIVGLANTVADVSSYTLLQRAVPDAVLARVFGILESIILGTVALGGVLASTLTEAFGLRTALVCFGVFLPLVVAVTWRSLLAIDAESPVPALELELLRGVPFLGALPPPTLESLAARLEPARFAARERIFSQGDPGDRFYVIAEGEAEVAVDGEVAQTLASGDSFGEIALLRDVPRTATVAAKGDVLLYGLERDEFLNAVAGHAPARQAALAVVEARLGRS
jgi:MFS family permease